MLLKLAQTLREDENLRQLILKLINPDMLTAAFGSTFSMATIWSKSWTTPCSPWPMNWNITPPTLAGRWRSPGFTWELYVEGNQVRMIRLFTTYSDTVLVYESQGSESDRRQEAFYAEYYGEPQFILTHDYTKNGSVSDGVMSLTQPYGPSLEIRYDMDSEKKSPLGIPQGSYRLYSDMLPVSLTLDVTPGPERQRGPYPPDSGGLLCVDGVFSSLEVNINATDGSSAKAPGVPPTTSATLAIRNTMICSRDWAPPWSRI